MSAQPPTVRWGPDLALEISDAAGAGLATLRFAVPGTPVAEWEPDDEEIALLRAEGLLSRVRMVREPGSVSVSLTVDNTSDAPVELPFLGFAVSVEPGWSGWTWGTELEGFVVVASTRGPGACVLVRLKRGFLRPVAQDTCFVAEASGSLLEPAPADRSAFLLSPPGALLGAHRRHEVLLEISIVDDLDAVAASLPPWLPETIAQVGDDITVALPDEAMVGGDGVSVSVVDTVSVVTLRSPGHRELVIHGPRGSRVLPLDAAPPLEDVVADLVGQLLTRRPQRLGEAAGFVVADALARRLAPDPERAFDWLDAVDWLDRDALLGDATAGLAASLQGETLQVQATWNLLGRRPVTPGYGLVVMRLWLASLAASGTPPPEALALLSRPAADEASALELSLLGYRGADVATGGVQGLIALLGGTLPGRPIGLSAARAAVAASVLRLCPESWEVSALAALTAAKTERLLLADYAGCAEDGAAMVGLDGLAWLLMGHLD